MRLNNNIQLLGIWLGIGLLLIFVPCGASALSWTQHAELFRTPAPPMYPTTPHSNIIVQDDNIKQIERHVWVGQSAKNAKLILTP
jgi:hypothetical protein